MKSTKAGIRARRQQARDSVDWGRRPKVPGQEYALLRRRGNESMLYVGGWHIRDTVRSPDGWSPMITNRTDGRDPNTVIIGATYPSEIAAIEDGMRMVRKALPAMPVLPHFQSPQARTLWFTNWLAHLPPLLAWELAAETLAILSAGTREMEEHAPAQPVHQQQRSPNGDVPGWRSDALLIRKLCRTGNEGLARDIQRLPLVRLEYVEQVRPRRQEIVHGPRFEHLPWDDFVLDLGVFNDGDGGPVRTWVRITSIDQGAAPHETMGWFTYVLWNLAPVTAAAKDELFMSSAGKFCGLDGTAHTTSPGEGHDEYVKSLATIAVASCFYLMQTPEHFVEVRKPPSAANKKNGAGSKKPWTRTDLPTIILMDPKKAPREKSEPLGGTHASPVIHLRRGGWVTLKHERFYRWPWCENFDPVTNPRRYFRKQCWAGSREWKDDTGRIYRVLDAENEPRIG